MLIGSFFPAKGLAQFLALRQTHQGTINANEPVSPPALDGVLRAIDRWQYALSVQFGEGAFLELGSRMSHRSAGQRLENLALGQLVEEFVQVALDRLEGLLQQKKHQPWKSQLALAGEILRSHSMASQEVLVAQLSAQSFDERGEIIGNVVDNRLHPQVNGGTNAKVQPKLLIISML